MEEHGRTWSRGRLDEGDVSTVFRYKTLTNKNKCLKRFTFIFNYVYVGGQMSTCM